MNSVFDKLSKIDGVTLVDILDKVTGLYEVQGEPDKNLAKAIFEVCVKNKWVITQLTPIETKLEDIFMELTTD